MLFGGVRNSKITMQARVPSIEGRQRPKLLTFPRESKAKKVKRKHNYPAKEGSRNLERISND